MKIYSKVIVGILFVFILTMNSLSIKAQELALFNRGLEQYNLNQYENAALEWKTIAKRIEDKSINNSVRLKQAAFAYVLSTIAFEKSNNSKAYDTWSAAIRLYLKSQTRWDEQKKFINTRIQKIQKELKSYSGAEASTNILDSDDYTILRIDELLNLGNYVGPRPGLQQQKQEVKESFYSNDKSSLFGNNPNVKKVIERPPVVGSRRGLRDPSLILGSRDAIRQARRSSRKASNEPFIGGIAQAYPETLSTNQDVNPYANIPQAAGLKTRAGSILFDEEESVDLYDEGRVSPEFMKVARIAWNYISDNINSKTAFVNTQNSIGRASASDIGDTLLSYMAAYEIGLINQVRFNDLLNKFMGSLRDMPLYKDNLPNRWYNINTLNMLDLEYDDYIDGSGWNSADIGRLLSALYILSKRYPERSSDIQAIISKWNLGAAIKESRLTNSVFIENQERPSFPSKLGYEQYAAHNFSLWGSKAPLSQDYTDAKTQTMIGIQIPYDARENSPLTIDAFVLGEIEHGNIDPTFKKSLDRLNRLHRAHWNTEKVMSVSGKINLKYEDLTAYNAVLYNNKPWQVVSTEGNIISTSPMISTKNAIALNVLYPGNFSDNAFIKVKNNHNNERGFYSGLDENGNQITVLDLNTNATILETILFMKNGDQPLIKSRK